MRQIIGGWALIVLGITAQALAQHYRYLPPNFEPHTPGAPAALSRTAYDLLRIGGWALIVAGLLLAGMGLISYAATQRRP
jgi:hypothetical protein